MRYVAAYLLATLSGNNKPTKNDIVRILESVGISIDHDKLDRILKALEGKKIEEVIAEGREYLANFEAATAGQQPAPENSTKEENADVKEVKEEEEEESEESDDDLGFGLFD